MALVLAGVLPELAVLPLRRAGATVAPSFAWDGGRSEAMRRYSEEKGTQLTYGTGHSGHLHSGPGHSWNMPPTINPFRLNMAQQVVFTHKRLGIDMARRQVARICSTRSATRSRLTASSVE
ncbi:hypothetical protein T492DRAFT_1016810 [Pavlovales sp. CCMP2436]|nr:hypothetical protein T492DRAFT_1016810 [Pavlovales sp. CCMP2436]